MKPKILIIILIIATFRLNSQTEYELNIETGKIKKRKYLPVKMILHNKSKKRIRIFFKDTIRLSIAKTPDFKTGGMYTFLKMMNQKFVKK